MDFTTRDMAPGERAFVAKSWVESFASSCLASLVTHAGRAGNPRHGWRPSDEYWECWNTLVNALLDRAIVRVAIDDAGLVAGFVCWEPWQGAVAVHYLYVRLLHRHAGVAKLLGAELPRGPVYYTHRSRSIMGVPEGWTYSLRPLLAVRAREAA